MTNFKEFHKFFHFDKNNFENYIEKFISDNIEPYIENASKGWLMSKYYDANFLNEYSDKEISLKTPKTKIKKSSPGKLSSKKTDFFSEILQITDLPKRWEYTKNLAYSKHIDLLQDSFPGAGIREAKQAAEQLLSKKPLNIVILGAGATGLFFANALKYELGDFVNVLVCENRTHESRLKKPYSREWLTYIPMSCLEGNIDPTLVEILKSLGNGYFMGVTINIFESLLLLSCKNLGVSFYFEPELDIEFIKNSKTNLIIDATGGKLDHLYPENKKPEAIEVNSREYQDNYYAQGLSLLGNINKQHNNFTLKPKGNRYYVYLDNKIINYSLFKITRIPISYFTEILNFVNANNEDNIFYAWQGTLSSEINEGLIIINLKRNCFEAFNKLIQKRITLDQFSSINSSMQEPFDLRIIALVELLQRLETDNKSIMIEPPFCYKPNVMLPTKNLSYKFSAPLIPIGDSFFCGHVKSGNGLGSHISYITKFVETISSSLISVEQILQEAIKFHQLGNLEKAEFFYQNILQSKPEHPVANNNLGILVSNAGKTELSITYFQNAINSNPNQIQYWINLIEALIYLQRLDDARSIIQKGKNIGINEETLEKYNYLNLS